MARKLQQIYNNISRRKTTMCILYVVLGTTLFVTPGCFAGFAYEGEAYMPHEVVYTSHAPASVIRVRTHSNTYRRYMGQVSKRYHRVRRHHRQRVRYHKHNHRVRHHRHNHRVRHHRHNHRVRKRIVTRRYNRKGNLKRRVTRRYYY